MTPVFSLALATLGAVHPYSAAATLTPISKSIAVEGEGIWIRSLDMDGSAYFANPVKKENFVWKKGKWSTFDVSDSPLKSGVIECVRGGNIVIATEDATVHHTRSFMKSRGGWVEIPFGKDFDPNQPTGNVFVNDVNKRGEVVGRWGVLRDFFAWNPNSKKPIHLKKVIAQSISDKGTIIGTWRENEDNWKSSRAASVSSGKVNILPNATNSSMFYAIAGRSGDILSFGQGKLYRYAKGNPIATEISLRSPIPDWSFDTDFFFNEKNQIVGSLLNHRRHLPMIYANGIWRMISIPSKFENVEPVYANKDGEIVCTAHNADDPNHFVFAKLSTK